MKKILILALGFIAVVIWAETFYTSYDNNQTVDDNISIEDLIIDDGDEVINNQDIEKPQN